MGSFGSTPKNGKGCPLLIFSYFSPVLSCIDCFDACLRLDLLGGMLIFFFCFCNGQVLCFFFLVLGVTLFRGRMLDSGI